MTDTPHQRCPYQTCSSSDAFNWNSSGYGFCHSCGEAYPKKGRLDVFDWVKDTYPTSPREKDKLVVKEVASTTYSNIRGLEEDVAKLYGIQRQLDSEGGWVRDALKWPRNIQYRLPDEGKKYTWKHSGVKANDLFGPDFNAGSSTRLYLTEGGFDAASLYQALGKTFPVKGLPSASIGPAFIKANYDYLNSFKEIVYAGELDEAGRKSADLFYSVFTDKMSYVPLTKHKDANEFLVAGDTNDLMWAARKPQRYSPQNFFTGDDEWDNAIRNQHPYQSYRIGHSGLDRTTRGLVTGGITFIKAPRGAGKTEFFRYMQFKLLKSHPSVSYALIHMEEMLSTTLRCIATYELGINVRTEEDQEAAGITTDQVLEAALSLKGGGRIIPFELLPTDAPLKIVEYCRLAASVYGAKFIFIDHIQRLIYRNGAADATGQLTQVGTLLAELAKELNIGIICISHVNDAGVTQYASALENEALICVEVRRDVDNEDEIIKDTSEFYVTKNRPFAKLGSAGFVYYDPSTTLLEETDYSEV